MPALNLSVCAFGGISANLTDKKDSEINRQPTTASACEVELIRWHNKQLQKNTNGSSPKRLLFLWLYISCWKLKEKKFTESVDNLPNDVIITW
jgi:hypothetical protein